MKRISLCLRKDQIEMLECLSKTGWQRSSFIRAAIDSAAMAPEVYYALRENGVVYEPGKGLDVNSQEGTRNYLRDLLHFPGEFNE